MGPSTHKAKRFTYQRWKSAAKASFSDPISNLVDTEMTQQTKTDTPNTNKIFQYLLMAGATALGTFTLMALSSMSGGYAVGSAPPDLSSRFTLPVTIHLATVIPAIPLGGYVLWRRKGDALHKLLGRIWAALMMITAIAALFIGRPGTGIAGTGFSFIHIFSVMTLVSIPIAIWAIRRGDVRGHESAIRGVYIGLVVAGLFSFIPGRIMSILAFG